MTPTEHRTLIKAYEIIGELLKTAIVDQTLKDLPKENETLQALENKIKVFFEGAPEINIPFNSPSRTGLVCYYRTLFCALAQGHYGMPYKLIGQYLNRSTDQVGCYISDAKHNLETSEDYRKQYERLKTTL